MLKLVVFTFPEMHTLNINCAINAEIGGFIPADKVPHKLYTKSLWIMHT